MDALVVPVGLYCHRNQVMLLGVPAYRQAKWDFLKKAVTATASVPDKDGYLSQFKEMTKKGGTAEAGLLPLQG